MDICSIVDMIELTVTPIPAAKNIIPTIAEIIALCFTNADPTEDLNRKISMQQWLFRDNKKQEKI